MKQFSLLVLLILTTACGISKKAIEKTEETKKVENEIEIKKDIEVVNKEDIAVENIDPRVVQKDTIIVVETSELPLPPKPPKSTNNSKNSFDVRLNNILQNYVSENGEVNYSEIKNDRTDLDIYIDYISENLPEDSWSKNEKLAYWINAYNALTIDLILRNYPIKSIKDIKDPWDQRFWKFGEKWINLNQIEHEILRKMDEPRIHFAIVCASFSCPKLQNKAFTASNLDTQLTNATKEFLADKNRNIISADKLQLSKIFKWFAKDFKTDGNLIDFLNKYTEVEISSGAKKSFLDYNWDLND
ncbi:uncharacterized protein DUF547 [Winogradskyella wandonensis]|uniref:Uncharacterized protein DUF547 n=1 Tax=Winogradskyella wandonensis TaxID=1442586 RepID=A0A4R1KQY7_9FLAO|nr:DUF547 domain-containing protein [Winogradskyella wandonensis]TCK67432.1 uncharacterized protein DUF547 [Winogradskyella wandonensis]